MNTKKQIASLDKMKLDELQARFAEVIGKKTRSPNRKFLVRKITEALQVAGSGAGEKAATPSASTATETAVATNSATTAAPTTEQLVENVPKKLTKLTVPQLQARYLNVVGRSTGSSNKAYLVWKLREAQKGRLPIGPRKSTQRDDVTFKILPLRMAAAIVDKLDEAWKRHGLHSRMDLFRKSLHDYLAGAGETEVAALLTDAASEKQ
jgi:hypothetical protein